MRRPVFRTRFPRYTRQARPVKLSLLAAATRPVLSLCDRPRPASLRWSRLALPLLLPLVIVAGLFPAAPAGAAGEPGRDNDNTSALEDDILKDIDQELKDAGHAGGLRIEVVGPDGEPIDGRRFVRGIPGQFAVSEFPHVFLLEGRALFTAGTNLDAQLGAGGNADIAVGTEPDPEQGDAVHYRAASIAKLPPGKYTIEPFGLAFEVDGAEPEPLHAALSVESGALRVHTVPVTFAAADAKTGAPLPLDDLRLTHGTTDLLENLVGPSKKAAAFNPLTVYLPRGTSYSSSLGDFQIDDAGKVVPGANAAAFANGSFIRKVTSDRSAAAEPVGKGYWLASHNLRRVFKRGEVGRFVVIASGEYPAGKLPVVVKPTGGARELTVGALDVPALAAAPDSRLFLLDTAKLAPGKYEIGVRHADGHPFAFEVVEILAKTPLYLFTMDACGDSPFTTDPEGLDELRKAGVRTWTRYGHGGMLNPGTPGKSPYPSAPAGAPAELRRPVDAARLLLDDSLRRGLTCIGYANRRDSWYNEGLAFHHSHPMSVERMVRRTHVFGQELQDYPAMVGMSYTWFPTLPGYVESGVPTDPFFGTRMEVLRARVKEKTGLEPLTPEQWQQFQKLGPETPAELVDRHRAYWRTEQRMGWRDHFALYNARLREVHKDLIATTSENAGHDGGKSLVDLAGAHDAMSFESYTDYGDWYMSSGFVADWGHGMAPGVPMWQQVDSSNDEPSLVGKQFYKFARGTEGIGVGVQSPAGKRANAKRALTNQFLTRYGPLVSAYEPDRSVAVLVNELQDRALFHAHALHSHLTRLGYGPVIVSERTVEKAVPQGVKVILIPNLGVPFSAQCLRGVADFTAKGGKVVLVGERSLPLAGATELKVPLKQLWDIGGFPAHLAMWAEFKKVRPALEKQMAALGIKPRNGADPDKSVVIPMRAGGVDYVAVIASPADTKDLVFNSVEGVAVKTGVARHVVNLVTGERSQAKGELFIDLVTEPVAFLALLPDEPKAVELAHPKQAVAGQTIELGAAVAGLGPDARVPVEFALTDTQGKERAVFYRMSGKGEPVRYLLGATEPAGRWTARARELLTGITATVTIDVTAAPGIEAVAAAEAVYLPHPDRLPLFMGREGPVRVVVEEETQADLLPQAERVVAALKKAGREAAVQKVSSASYDTLWMRWYPGKAEEKLLAKIDAGEVVGYRGNMRPYINTAKREHVPEKGGWSDINPPYILRTDVVVFSGGRIAESLAAVTDWTATPNTPGKGNGVLDVALSPFWADRHALAVVANEPAGREKTVGRLVNLIETRGKTETASPFAAPKTAAATATTTGSKRTTIDTPLKGFVPPALAEHLAASPDGFAVVRTKAGDAVFSPDGKLTQVMPRGDLRPTIGAGGAYVSGAFEITRRDPAWHFPTAWNVTLRTAAAGGKPGRFVLPREVDWMGDRFRGWDGGYAVSPDGRTFFAGGPGGGFLLLDVAKGSYREFHEPPGALGFYEKVRVPSFVSAAKFSPDGAFVAYTIAHHPSGYGGMGTPPLNPYSTGIRLARADTGEIVWRRDTVLMSDSSLATAGGDCLAVSAGGKRVAFIDWDHNAVLLDERGKDLLREPLFDWKAKYDGRTNPAPLRAELTPDGAAALFASDGHVMLVDAAGAAVGTITVTALGDVRLAPDGGRVFAADLDGVVTCFDRAGKKQWELQTQGAKPRLAVAPGALLVAEGAGNLLRVDAGGRVIGKTPMPAGGRPTASADFAPRPLAGPAAYREPGTLAALKKQGAKQVAAWEPTGQGTPRFGRAFHPVTSEVTLTASGSGPHVVHLVYRHGGQGATVTVDDGRTARTFVLDLPTPEYRVVDLPCDPSGKLTVTLPPAAGLEVAELSVHGFSFPGNNLLYIESADAGLDRAGGLDLGGEDPAGGAIESDILDDNDTSAVSKRASGKMKDAGIYSTNPDPDQVEGRYLRATGNPLEAFDGKRFVDESGRTASAWTNGQKGTYGSRILVDLPYVAKPKLCVTYERTLVQSEVMKGLAVLKGRDVDLDAKKIGPDNLYAERRALSGAFDNDQFFNVFELGGVDMEAFAVYAYSGRGRDHGLSEVELYE